MTSIDLLIFDLDGTLVNTLEDIASSVDHTLSCLGKAPIGLDAVQRYVGDGIETLLIRALEGKPADLSAAVSIYKEHHRNNLVVRSRLYPGVIETLEHFRSVPLAVISNKTTEFVRPVLEQLGIAAYFTTVIGADAGLLLKPAPDSIRRVMAVSGAPKERTVMVGDGTTDIRAGRAAGVITCAVTYGYRPEEELLQAGPDHIMRSITELMVLFSLGRSR